MGIEPHNMPQRARKLTISHTFDIDGTGAQATAFVDNDYDLIVRAVRYVYVIATSTGTQLTIKVGTAADDDHYATAATLVSKALGTITNQTILSTDMVPKGTALIVIGGTAGNDTGAVTVQVEVERIG